MSELKSAIKLVLSGLFKVHSHVAKSSGGDASDSGSDFQNLINDLVSEVLSEAGQFAENEVEAGIDKIEGKSGSAAPASGDASASDPAASSSNSSK